MNFEAWLVEKYGQDLSGVTEIKDADTRVTGSLDVLAKCTLLETLNLFRCHGTNAFGEKVSEGLTGT